MTTSTSPSAPLHLSDVAELIAAVPAMLGFHPQRSLVVMSLTPSSAPSRAGGRVAEIGAVMRHDLILPDDHRREGAPIPTMMLDAFERFCAVCGREGATSVIAILVDDRFDDPSCPAALAARRLLEEFDEHLERFGIELVNAHATAAVEYGSEWFVPGGDVCGTLPDPESSIVSATRVFHGGPIRRSRGELAQLFAPLPEDERTRVAEFIEDAVDARDTAYEHASRSGGSGRADRAEVCRVLDHLSSYEKHETLTPQACAELAVLLANPTVRDAVLALAAGEKAEVSERMWTALTRALPDPERADAAALVAFGAYVRGDGPLAGVALGAALASNPRHRLSDLLDQALQAGLRPEAIRGLADTGYEISARLGVAMPAPGRSE